MRFNNKNVILLEHIIDYLCFEANTAGSTIALSNTNISPNIEYSRDKNTWTTWDYSALSLQNVGDTKMNGSNLNITLPEYNYSIGSGTAPLISNITDSGSYKNLYATITSSGGYITNNNSGNSFMIFRRVSNA